VYAVHFVNVAVNWIATLKTLFLQLLIQSDDYEQYAFVCDSIATIIESFPEQIKQSPVGMVMWCWFLLEPN